MRGKRARVSDIRDCWFPSTRQTREGTLSCDRPGGDRNPVVQAYERLRTAFAQGARRAVWFANGIVAPHAPIQVELADLIDDEGHSLVYHAVLQGDAGFLRTLFAAGFPIAGTDVPCGTGDNSVLLAVHLEDAEVVQVLIEAGAAPTRAFMNSTGACSVSLEEAVSRECLLLCALRDGAPDEVVSALLPTKRIVGGTIFCDEAMDLDATDEDGRSCLHYAARRDDEGIVLLLLALGASPTIQDGSLTTPLHLAVEIGNATSTASLLQANAWVDAADDDGCTYSLCGAQTLPCGMLLTPVLARPRGARASPRFDTALPMISTLPWKAPLPLEHCRVCEAAPLRGRVHTAHQQRGPVPAHPPPCGRR